MKIVKWLLGAILIGGLILFIWRGWGEEGNLSGLLLGIWNFFYAIWDAVANTIGNIWNKLIG
jgi:hypothetical protein